MINIHNSIVVLYGLSIYFDHFISKKFNKEAMF